jgi:GT2 family glycosyltransferase
MINDMRVSFIIPARNEEEFLLKTLTSIRDYAENLKPYEIIVVDHESTDRTRDVAIGMGAQVHVQQGGTIGAARNRGVAFSKGAILIFLDADVMVTKEWGRKIGAVVYKLEHGAISICGSWYGVGRPPAWIERFWFQPLEKRSHSHVNSGHLVVSRCFFEKLGGFDDRLETGEDYDFSRRAVKLGAALDNDPELAVVHLGYPKTIGSFFKREMWHGRGDWVSVASVLKSPVLVLALLVSFLSVAAAGFAAVGFIRAGITAAMATAAVCIAVALKRYWPAPLKIIAVNSALYYVYFIARALAWLRPRTMLRNRALKG